MEWKSTQHRLDVEFGIFNALKTIFGLSKTRMVEPSSTFVLEQCEHLSPEIFDEHSILSQRVQDVPLVREYKQKARLESKKLGEDVSPYKLAEKDIEEFEELLNYNEASGQRDEDDAIASKVNKLKAILPKLREIIESENEWILRDMTTARSLDSSEDDIPIPPFNDGRCAIYETGNRLLKIRRLHPDRAEHLTGADMIYERYDISNRLVRLVYIQYKMWDDKNVLYFSRGNISKQIRLLTNKICDSEYCKCRSSKSPYRLPHCAAFLRATNRLQPNSSKRIISRGLFLPICEIDKCATITDQGAKKLSREGIQDTALNQDLFESLYNKNMVGSDWLTYDEAEQFYRENQIIQSDEKLIYHAQDYSI